MRRLFSTLLGLFAAFALLGQPCSDLFISEYMEGSSNNKCLELYNPTDETIDLEDQSYQILIYFNDNVTPGNTIDLTGTIAAGATYVVCDDGEALGVSEDLAAGGNFYNGDDPIALVKNGNAVDVIGQIGVRVTYAQDITLRRKSSVTEGDTNPNDAFDPATEWDEFAENTINGFGSHTFDGCAATMPMGCTELYFSEYIEGSGFNKAIEIYNPTDAAIDLAAGDYDLLISFNGGTGATTVDLNGTIAPGDVHVVASVDANAAILAQADQPANGGIWSGDDAIILIKGSTPIDYFGSQDTDPGTQWEQNGNETQDQTLRRIGAVTGGLTSNPAGNFPELGTEWEEFDVDDASDLGMYTSTGCPAVMTPSNDLCANAIDITCGQTVTGSTVGAADITNSDISVAGSKHWYRFVGTGDNITVSLCDATDFNSFLAIVTGDCGSQTFVVGNDDVCGDDAEIVDFATTVGVDYYIVVAGGGFPPFPTGNYELSLTCTPPGCAADGDIFINEIHYDNVGSDINEFVEVAVLNSAMLDLADFTVSLYNGSPTQRNVYGSATLDQFAVGEDDGTYTYYTMMVGGFGVSGIQNGNSSGDGSSPDGLSLSCSAGLVEFLSYEGSFEAANGPAMGETSTDIGVAESSATGEFASLQLISNAWTVTGCNTKGAMNEDRPVPAAPAVGVGFKAVCQSDDISPSLANTGISTTISLGADEKVVWVIREAPAGSGYSEGDEFTVDNCGDPFKNFGDFAVANSSKVIRVQDASTLAAGDYEFEVFTEICSSGCRSISEIGFTIRISEQPTVAITADPDGDICLGTMGVQYNAVVTSTDGGTYSYDWCAYNSGDGSGTCFGGFSDNTAQMPTRNWVTSAGPKSVGVTATSDVAGCTAEDLYSFNVVAPPMVECPEDQMVTLVTNPGTFECETPVMFTNPMAGTEACSPYTLTIAIDGGTPETVTPGEEYTLIVDALGMVEVTYTLTDGLGGETTCSFNVIVDGLPCGLVDNGGIGCGTSTSMYDQGAASFSLTTDCAPNTMLYLEDESAFVFTELCGDGEITAQVTDVQGTGFAGVMMRETEAPGAKKVALGTNAVNRLRKEVRVIDGYPSSAAPIASFNQFWVRVVRSGNTFSAFASTDGVFWQPYISQVVIMDECIVVGLFTYSEKDGNMVTASFSDVAITGLDLAGSASSATVNLGANLGAPIAIGVQGLSIYPNPAVSEITLDLAKFEGQAADIRIFNQMGQLMGRTQIEEVQFNEVLDVSKLNMGVYNIMVKVGNEVVTERLVIARP
ncbi:MAG: lamin tail domain-containing protein [Bacteroidota bacterium]